MKLEILISGRDEMRLAAEFMARITAMRYPTIPQDDIRAAVSEESAGIVAEQTIEKAAKPAKPKKPEPVAPIDEPVVAKVDRAALQRLAASKAAAGKAPEVKAIIAEYGAKIVDVPEAKLAELLSRLEGLE